MLEMRFGNRFVISQTVCENWLSRAKIRNGDLEDMSRFCTEIYNALTVLETTNDEGELSRYRTPFSLADKLPQDSQPGWEAFARSKVDTGQDLTCQLFYDYLSSHVKDRHFVSTKIRQHDKQIRSQSYAAATTPKIADRERKIKQTYGNQSIRQRVATFTMFEHESCCRRVPPPTPCGVNGWRVDVLLHDASSTKTAGVMSTKSNSFDVLMKTVVELAGPNRKKRCVAYLDEGSSITLISKQLLDELGLDGNHAI